MTQHDKSKKPTMHVPGASSPTSQPSYRRNQAEHQFPPSSHDLANISIRDTGSSLGYTRDEEVDSVPHEVAHVPQQAGSSRIQS